MKMHVKFLVVMVAMLSAVFMPCRAIGPEDENGNVQKPDTVVSVEVSGMSISDRIQLPGGSVTVEAPALLLRRALPQTEPAESAETAENEETQEEATEQQVVRTKNGKAVGFRVQVYADNNVRSAKTEARQRERVVGQSFPEYDTYVSYASPYWRLRVGDFRSQYEAEKAAAEIRKAFPHYAKEVRVVRDRVNIR